MRFPRLLALISVPAAIGVAVLAIDAGATTHGVKTREVSATPIEHLVVIYDESISFDHYFGT